MFTLSPLGRRRLAHFKANRRGWWSLWLFIGLFTVCLGGELIANDKPLAIHYKDHWYFPIVSGYEETDFGGELPFEPDYSSDYVRKLIASGIVTACHDLSDGGLAVALAEMAMASGVGATIPGLVDGDPVAAFFNRRNRVGYAQRQVVVGMHAGFGFRL